MSRDLAAVLWKARPGARQSPAIQAWALALLLSEAPDKDRTKDNRIAFAREWDRLRRANSALAVARELGIK